MVLVYIHARIKRECGGRGQRVRYPPPPPPMKNHKAIRLLSNTGPDPLELHKATKSTFNVRPPLARQRNAIFNGVSLVGR